MIRVTGLTKRFGHVIALQDVSFSVYCGDVAAYIGPNGSGKTTTIKCITGLCTPDSGSVTVLGEIVVNDYSSIGKRVALILENHGLYPNLTARENLQFYARLIGMPAKTRNVRIDETLKSLGLHDRHRSLVKTFSKGMLRKLAIGRAFLVEPQLLILDEPFDGIDVGSRMFIMDMVKTWAKSEEHCVLLASHNMYEVEELSSKIIILKNGQIAASGTVSSLQPNTGEKIIEVVFSEPCDPTSIKRILDDYGSVHSFTLNDNHLVLFTDTQHVNGIAALFHQHGISFQSIMSRRESLNDIYLRIIGHGA